MKHYYQDKYATIYHGDCLEILLDMPKVDLVLTDPPYGVNGSTKKAKYVGTLDDTREFVSSFVVGSVLPVLRNKAKMVVLTPGIKCLWLYPEPDSFGVFFYPAAVGWQAWGSADTNPILYYGKCDYKGALSWSASSVAPKNGHPCPKPIEQWRKLLNRVQPDNGTILDPFGGSCTTAVAAKQLNRKCITIEIEEKYCEIGAKRLSQEVLDLA